MKQAIMFIAALCVVTVAGVIYVSTGKVSAAVSSQLYTLTINGKAMHAGKNELVPYEQKGTIMVPLRTTAEALRYKVSWVAAEKAMLVEDNVQSALVKDGMTQAKFTGKLKIINLSQDVQLSAPVQTQKGITYISASFFEPFFNDVVVNDGNVSISAQVSTIQ